MALVALVLAAVAVLITLSVLKRRTRAARGAPAKRTEVARINEEIEQTGLGAICLVLLLLHQAGAALLFVAVNGAVQQAALAAIWIGGNVLWGLGVALGRRRTYVVTRRDAPDQ